jgi:hypothetical protein
MEIFAASIGRLYWELSSIFEFALRNWAITFVALLLMIRWAGNERRRSERV